MGAVAQRSPSRIVERGDHVPQRVQRVLETPTNCVMTGPFAGCGTPYTSPGEARRQGTGRPRTVGIDVTEFFTTLNVRLDWAMYMFHAQWCGTGTISAGPPGPCEKSTAWSNAAMMSSWLSDPASVTAASQNSVPVGPGARTPRRNGATRDQDLRTGEELDAGKSRRGAGSSRASVGTIRLSAGTSSEVLVEVRAHDGAGPEP